MLLEMAVADAYAIPFEFVPDTSDRLNDLSRYYQHPTYTEMVPGHYTDDTQRSIANAELLLSAREQEAMAILYTPVAYMAHYQQTFRRDPRPGYSRRFEAFLKENLETRPAEMMLKLNRKPTNGAVMGAAVLGFLPTVEAVMLASAAQGLSTHSYATIPYAQIVALSAHYFIKNIGHSADLCGWLYTLLGESGKDVAAFLTDTAVRSAPSEKVTMEAASVVRLMLHAIPRHNSLADLVKLAVDVGGDTDSAAAIMVAVASESHEYVNDLPEHLVQGLETGDYGRAYLESLDRQLREGM